MKIVMDASFDEHKDKFKCKGDNSGRIWFDFDGSQYPQVVKLGLVPCNTLVRVTFEYGGKGDE